MKITKKGLVLFFIAVALVFIATNVDALSNPAAVYCGEMGYNYEIKTASDGSQSGICIMPDDSKYDEWEFFSGKKGKKFSYCAKHGYEIVTENGEAFCVVPKENSGNGTDGEAEGKLMPLGMKKTSVSEMMNLSEKSGGREMPERRKASEEEKSALLKSMHSSKSYDYGGYSFWDWRNPPAGTEYNPGNYTYFDNTTRGWLTPVKDQGGCGSCWAFSTVGGLEAVYEIEQNNSRLNPDLSEQYLVSCSDAGNCEDGGQMFWALDYAKSDGISDEVCFPYIGADGNCGNSCSDHASRLWTLDDYGGGWVDPGYYFSLNNTEAMQYLIDNGPMIAGVYAYWSEDGGIERCSAYGDTHTNHGVVLAGYNYTGNESTSYWIIKNSWGDTAGPDGSGYYKVGFNECNFTGEFEWPMGVNAPAFKPRIALNSPDDDYATGDTQNSFNFTVYNRNATNATCDLIIDDEIMNTTGTTVLNATATVMAYNITEGAGEYNWSINCWENGFGIANSSETRSLAIAAIKVDLNSPEDGAILSDANITFNCTASDEFNLTNVSLYGNWSGGWHANETNSSPENNTPVIFSKTLDVGAYEWSCQACNNQSQCSFAASNRTLTVPPNITIVINYPDDGVSIKKSSFPADQNLNWTATDRVNDTMNCSIYLNGDYVQSETCTNDTICNTTLAGLAEGTYSWYANCSDVFENNAVSDEYTFTLAEKGGGGGGGGGEPPANETSGTNETGEANETAAQNQTSNETANLGDLNQYPQGIEKSAGAGQRIDFRLGSESHAITIMGIYGTFVTIEISSDPIIANISVNETKAFDINGDGEDDVAVWLKDIRDSEAVLQITYAEKKQAEPPANKTSEAEAQKESTGIGSAMPRILGCIAALVLILLVIVLAHRRAKRKAF